MIATLWLTLYKRNYCLCMLCGIFIRSYLENQITNFHSFGIFNAFRHISPLSTIVFRWRMMTTICIHICKLVRQQFVSRRCEYNTLHTSLKYDCAKSSNTNGVICASTNDKTYMFLSVSVFFFFAIRHSTIKKTTNFQINKLFCSSCSIVFGKTIICDGKSTHFCANRHF